MPEGIATKQIAAAHIRVNGQDEPLTAATLSELLAEKVEIGQRGIAVALNGSVVPRSVWDDTALHAGDNVEIVRALKGG
jgi:sulfur carrier protein